MPKNLASALIEEAGELLEHFQWLTEEQSRNLPADKKQAVAYEMADVLLYLVQMTDLGRASLLAHPAVRQQVEEGCGAMGRPTGSSLPMCWASNK
ncbi:MazG nucleotide pyrophosphohydrolase domain-containing protein [Acidovorax sp. sic0104]|uniref:MazG nucleotide pyrophosphohydrolase domain-containing protein n=1 Tax=Acidovorax sp. sic0104 TaxID=2854784 RepID=UPI0030D7FDA9